MQETQVGQVWSQGWEEPQEKEMSTHSSVSCLENSMDRGGLQAPVHGVAKDSDMTEHTHTH